VVWVPVGETVGDWSDGGAVDGPDDCEVVEPPAGSDGFSWLDGAESDVPDWAGGEVKWPTGVGPGVGWACCPDDCEPVELWADEEVCPGVDDDDCLRWPAGESTGLEVE
jgi:hypothetical protein